MHPLWNQLAERANVPLTDAQADQLEQYLQLLLQANQRLNLTRIVDPASAAILHVADALTLLPFLPVAPHDLGDVGSGGGVPGIVLAIARPDVNVTLIESTQKKAVFLQQAIDDLKLSHVHVLNRRAEGGGLEGRFDVVTARAVAPLDQLAQWCLPLCKPGGKVLAMKGKKIEEELPAARKILPRLRGGDPAIHPTPLPGAESHVIVEIRRGG